MAIWRVEKRTEDGWKRGAMLQADTFSEACTLLAGIQEQYAKDPNDFRLTATDELVWFVERLIDGKWLFCTAVVADTEQDVWKPLVEFTTTNGHSTDDYRVTEAY